MGSLFRVVVSISVLVASSASAGDRPSGRSGVWYESARVTDVEPIIRIVQVSTPQTTCWEEPVRYTARPRNRYRSFTPSVLGGIVGGVVGNQFGGGRGQDAMTVAGALLGASIGRDAAHRRHHRYSQPASRSGVERYCEVEDIVREEERMDGYRVTYEFRGREFVTRTESEPGPEIRVRVQVNPVVED